MEVLETLLKEKLEEPPTIRLHGVAPAAKMPTKMADETRPPDVPRLRAIFRAPNDRLAQCRLSAYISSLCCVAQV